MKTATKLLLALVVALGFVSEAGAQEEIPTSHDYTVKIGRHYYGFQQYDMPNESAPSIVRLGSLGNLRIPFTATQGFVGFCLIVVFALIALIALLATLSVRWKKKRATP